MRRLVRSSWWRRPRPPSRSSRLWLLQRLRLLRLPSPQLPTRCSLTPPNRPRPSSRRQFLPFHPFRLQSLLSRSRSRRPHHRQRLSPRLCPLRRPRPRRHSQRSIPLSLPLRPLKRLPWPSRRLSRQSPLLKTNPLPPPPLLRRVEPRVILTPHRPPRLCLPAEWLCPRRVRAPSTRRPTWLQPPRLPEPAIRQLAQAFNAASPSLTATGPLAVPAAIRSALPAALAHPQASSLAAHVPSILRAPPPAATRETALPALPARAQVLPRALALEHLVRAASAVLRVPAAPRRQPARPRARRAPPPEAEAAAPSSIPRPKKAR